MRGPRSAAPDTVQVQEIRARLRRDGRVVRDEERALAECLYVAEEVLLMLAGAGFRDVSVEACWSGGPATDDDVNVVSVGRA